MARKPGAWPPAYSPEESADPRSLLGLITPFVEWMRVRSLSEFTIHRRIHVMKQFCAWCDVRGITKPQEVTKPIVDRYQRHLYHYRSANGEPLSFRSQHSYLSAVQSFFRFLTRQNYIMHNPAADLDLPRCGRQIPRAILTIPEVEQIMNTPNINHPVGLRDRAMLETLYSTGIRRLELLKLLIYDLNIDHGTVMIREGKCKMDRVIPIGDRALAWVRKYLEDVRPSFVMEPDEGVLFLKPTGERITPSCLTHVVTKHVVAANIGKSGSCHMFRHTMATLMLEGGADIRYIQQMLGHARLETTSIYTHVSIRKLKEIYLATHPGATLKPNHESDASDEPPPGARRAVEQTDEEGGSDDRPPAAGEGRQSAGSPGRG